MNSPTVEKIRLEAVSKSFASGANEMPALATTSLSVRARQFVALVGPSGCGKSTVLNMIAGLFQPSAGRVLYDGNPVVDINRDVGYMTQKDTLLPWRTVSANIGIALELASHGVSDKERNDRIAEMVDLVGLKGFEQHYPAQLSGGMRKRAALARTLIYRPETLLMDEPFGALDAQLKLVMQAELMRITAAQQVTVVFVTHDLEEAITLADQVYVFSGRPGRIKAIRDIALPKPRDTSRTRFHPDFAETYEYLWDQLKDEVAAGAAA